MSYHLVFMFVSPAFMMLSLWVAFSPAFRPISWPAFWFNIGAAALNLVATITNTYAYFSIVPTP